MKVVAEFVEVVAWFDCEGLPHPVKFKLYKEDNLCVKKIDRILKKEMQKLAGKDVLVYTCQSIFENNLKIYELKYELDSCRWTLFKI